MAKTTLQPDLKEGTFKRGSTDTKDRFMKGFSCAVDVENRTIDGVASTINLDRHGDIILPSAIAAHADAFMASNAPFLSAHTHRTSEGAPSQIGWVVDMKIDAEKVKCKFKFARTAAADEWWQIASDREGKGIAFSIGFIPIRYIYGTVADIIKEFPDLKKPLAGQKDDDKLWVLTEVELIEISAVPCPANRESLQGLAAKFFGDVGGQRMALPTSAWRSLSRLCPRRLVTRWRPNSWGHSIRRSKST